MFTSHPPLLHQGLNAPSIISHLQAWLNQQDETPIRWKPKQTHETGRRVGGTASLVNFVTELALTGFRYVPSWALCWSLVEAMFI